MYANQQYGTQGGFQYVLGMVNSLNDTDQQSFNRNNSSFFGAPEGDFGYQPPSNNMPLEDLGQQGGGFFQDQGNEADAGGANWWQSYRNSSNLESVPIIKKKPSHKRRKNKSKHFAAPKDDDPTIESPIAAPSAAKATPSAYLAPTYKLVWTTGSSLISLIVLVVSLIVGGNIESLATNPFAGPSDIIMVKMGAKYGPLILAGDWWRFVSAIFVHTGIIHFMFAIFILGLSKEVERKAGFWRSFFVFIMAGAYGNIMACIFEPDYVEGGSTGAIFGWLGMILADLISSWNFQPKPGYRLTVVLTEIVVCFAIGLTPYINNFAHIAGFIMGLLGALMLLPHMDFGQCEKVCRGVVAFLAYPIMATLFTFFLVLFYRRVDTDNSWCTWCHYLNCVNISGWCPNEAQVSDLEGL